MVILNNVRNWGIAGITIEADVSSITVENDRDDVGKIYGVFDINETSGSNCTKDVIADEEVTYSYSIDKISSIFESTETEFEGVMMADVLSESEPVTVNTNVLFSITDVVVDVSSAFG